MWMTPCCNLAIWYHGITPGPHYDLPGHCHVNMFTLCTGTLNAYIIFIVNYSPYLFLHACVYLFSVCGGVCSTVRRLDVKNKKNIEGKREQQTNNKERKSPPPPPPPPPPKKKRRRKIILLVTKLTLTSFFPLAISFLTLSILNPPKWEKSYCFNPDEYCWR